MDNELSIMPYKLIWWKGKLHVQWKPSILSMACGPKSTYSYISVD